MIVSQIRKVESGSKYIFNGVVAMFLLTLVSVFELHFGVSEILIKILRYCLGTFSTIAIIVGVCMTYNTHYYNRFMRIILYLFVVVTIITCLRGLPFILSGEKNFVHLKIILSGEILLYILPLLILSKLDLLFYKKLFFLCFLSSVVYLIITVPQIQYYSASVRYGAENITALATGSVLLVLSFAYHNKKIKFTSILTILVALILMVILARRNKVIYYSSALGFMIIIHLFTRTMIWKKKKTSFLITLLISLFLIFLFVEILEKSTNLLINRFESGFSSRELVIKEFENDFNSNPHDWVWGRGMFGSYKSVLSNNGTSGSKLGDRFEIENGYLTHILHGGGIYLGLILCMIIPAIFYGFSQSNNILTKSFSSILVIYLVDMVGFGVPETNLKFLFVWLAVPFCLSEKSRSLPDHILFRNLRIK